MDRKGLFVSVEGPQSRLLPIPSLPWLRSGLSVFSGERFAYGFNRTQSTDWAVYTHYSSTFNATQVCMRARVRVL